jgi:hypothetical protein
MYLFWELRDGIHDRGIGEVRLADFVIQLGWSPTAAAEGRNRYKRSRRVCRLWREVEEVGCMDFRSFVVVGADSCCSNLRSTEMVEEHLISCQGEAVQAEEDRIYHFLSSPEEERRTDHYLLREEGPPLGMGGAAFVRQADNRLLRTDLVPTAGPLVADYSLWEQRHYNSLATSFPSTQSPLTCGPA